MPNEMQGAKPVVDWEKTLEKIVCDCDKKEVYKQSTCRKLGYEKHECCDEKIEHLSGGAAPGQEQLAPERGYTNPNSPPVKRINMTRFESYLSRKNPGSAWPDAMLLGENGQPKQLFEFKFKCPKGTKVYKKKDGKWAKCSGNQPTPTWTRYKGNSRGQLGKYEDLSRALGIDIGQQPPTLIDNEGCQ